MKTTIIIDSPNMLSYEQCKKIIASFSKDTKVFFIDGENEIIFKDGEVYIKS